MHAALDVICHSAVGFSVGALEASEMQARNMKKSYRKKNFKDHAIGSLSRKKKKMKTEITSREHRADSLKMIAHQTQVTTLKENAGGEIWHRLCKMAASWIKENICNEARWLITILQWEFSCPILPSLAASKTACAFCDAVWDTLCLRWPLSPVCPYSLGLQRPIVYTNRNSTSIFTAICANLFSCCKMDKSFSKDFH